MCIINLLVALDTKMKNKLAIGVGLPSKDSLKRKSMARMAFLYPSQTGNHNQSG
jgi:hypothetical protein